MTNRQPTLTQYSIPIIKLAFISEFFLEFYSGSVGNPLKVSIGCTLFHSPMKHAFRYCCAIALLPSAVH
ncbi:hypothetical protein QWZ13_18535 [Reinekea marina]|uniref:hypothetical protein n=1 Tax=Reinekea marina TaxID=1310421 RepID=UPI0025B4173B|nr:hypothetical protein [Reinekea marina]MDN3650910.1 hypothetical protein [Reinekea marina]